MKLLSYLLALGLFRGTQAWVDETEPIVWVTVTTDIYTTFCPSSTEFSYGPNIYTASASQFLTITDCPCTFSQPMEKPSSAIPVANSPPVAPPVTQIEKPSSAIPEANSPTPFIPPKESVPPISVSKIFITVTEIVSELTTFCSSSTKLVQNSKTYTVTKPTTLTITDCPCTISRVVPGTIQTTTTSVLTTHFTDSTTITLSGITYPVQSAGSTTIPLVQVSTVPIQSASDSIHSPNMLSLPTAPFSDKSSSQLVGSTKSSPSTTGVIPAQSSSQLLSTTKASPPTTGVIPAQSSSQLISITKTSLSETGVISAKSSSQPVSATEASLSKTDVSSGQSSTQVISSTKTRPSTLSNQEPQVTGNVATRIDARIGIVAAAGFAAVFI